MRVTKRDGTTEVVQFDKITERLQKLCWDIAPDVTRVAAKVCSQIVDGIATTTLDELTADVAYSLGTEHPEYATLASRILVSNLHKNTSDDVLETYSKMRDVLSPDFFEVVAAHRDELRAMVDYDRDYDFDYFGVRTMLKMYLTHVDSVVVERPQHMFLRVAIGIWGDDMDRVRETYQALSTKQFTHASPTLFNAGLRHPQLSSCFLATIEPDSIDGIFDTATKCARISKFGGGIGLSASAIRAKGSVIKGTNGRSDGLVPMLRVFNTVAQYVNQGGRRKGSIAVYLEPHHADFLDFLDLRRNTGDDNLRARDLFLAAWIPDLFMKRVETDGTWSLMDPAACPGLNECFGSAYDELYERYEAEGRYVKQVPAQDVWRAIVRSQIETGLPYILFKDAANAKSNQQHLGTIKSSNLCVAGDTRILTKTGYHPIATLEGQRVEVWNGEEFSETTVVKTGTDQKLLTVTLSNGSKIRCTPYHKFFVADTTLEARDLTPGDTIIDFKLPDGTLCQNIKIVSVTDMGDVEDTWCFNEPKRHAGIFEGTLTSQCTEVVEYSSPDEIAVCNLGSLSLPAFVVDRRFDFDALRAATRILARNLDRVIDKTYYPVEEARRSNLRHRPVGIGVQGLADVFQIMGLPYDSTEAAALNRHIFEHVYYAALETSVQLARELGAYETFPGSPASRGLLQPDLWNVKPHTTLEWDKLRNDVQTHGLRNSLSLAPMPTASTAQLLGNTEAFEPPTSNLYSRRTLAGEFAVVNKHLVNELLRRGLWTPALKNKIVAAEGSVQHIPEIPEDVKAVYKTAWELSMKTLIDMAADRGAYVCQSQSLNLFVAEPTFRKLSSMHFYAWKRGLKTGCYYLRTKPAARAVQVTVEPDCVACSS